MSDALLLWGIALIALGLLLIFVEVIVPSGGIISIVALIAAVAGIAMLFRYDVIWGIAGTLATLLLGPVIFFSGLNLLPATGFGRQMLAMDEDDRRQDAEIAERQEASKLASLVGHRGTAVTDLRPSGLVQLEGERFDAFAVDAFIAAGESIEVTGRDMRDLKVRRVSDA